MKSGGKVANKVVSASKVHATPDGCEMSADSSRDAELQAMIDDGLVDPEELLPKKKKVKKKAPTADYWDKLGDWKSVSANDDFLLGAEEGGFGGLEILEGCTIIDSDIAIASKENRGEEKDEFDGSLPKSKSKGKGGVKSNVKLADRPSLAPKSLGGPSPKPAAAVAATAAVVPVAVVPASVDTPALMANGDGEMVEAGNDEDDGRAARKRQRAVRLKAKRKERILRKKRKKNELGEIRDRICALELSGTGTTHAVSSAGGVGAEDGKESDDGDEEEWSGSQDGLHTEQRSSLSMAPESSSGMDVVAEASSGGQGLSKKERVKIARTRKRALRKLQRRNQAEEEGSGVAGALQILQEANKGALAADVSEWRSLLLHPLIEEGLSAQGFTRPTPIQRVVLPLAIRDRLDIIGAAQTGSGKTLAFGLPIMQLLMQEREVLEAGGGTDPHSGKLRALVMCPTRELALQVCNHLQAVGKVCGIKAAAIVGGLAHVKQTRVLSSRPQVIVATPGRLWELMHDNDAHLSDLSHLSFLVLDEADRMVQLGHYPELTNILELIPQPGDLKKDTYDNDFEEAFKKDTERERNQPARPRQGRGRNGSLDTQAAHDSDADDERDTSGKEEEVPEREEEEMEEGEGMDSENDGAMLEDGDEEDADTLAATSDSMEVDAEEEEEEGQQSGSQQGGEEAEGGVSSAGGGAEGAAGGSGKWPPRRRQQQQQKHKGGHMVQTFVFSATLTLPTDLRRRLRKGGGGAQGSGTMESLIDKVKFRGEPHIVDLTTARRLATRVEEAKVDCTDKERDEFLYYLLAMHPGRTLVFVNAVSALRRVAALLKILGLPTMALHAQQQQRQRLKALDRFKTEAHGVLVATDVAARGLDVKGVRCVIHYQLPASTDTYIHRCGRTARGESDGLSISIVTPKEAGRFSALCRAMGRDAPPPSFPVDLQLIPQVHSRMQLAVRVDELERKERRSKADKAWMETNSKLLDLEYSSSGGSDDEFVERSRGGGPKLSSLRGQLADLLATPLQHKMSTKFFTGGAAASLHHSGVKAAGGGGSKVVDTVAGETPAQIVSVVPKAVALATRMQESKDAVQSQQQAQKTKAQAHAAKKKELKASQAKLGHTLPKPQAKVGKKERGKAARPGSAGSQVQAASKGGRRGIVVIPPIALGRNKDAPEALDALRKRLALLNS